MTVAELLACEVVDANGDVVGEVHDLRFERRGAGAAAGYHLHYLMFSSGSVFRRLGYGYGEMKGPWALMHALRWLAAHRGWAVGWEHVTRIEGRRIHIDMPVSACRSILDLTGGD
ncbi:MAG: hypothetical protein QOF18_2650 [Frankiaceae bacterium]|jgi:hypothetical protein|nr:hypothetical protein [Frankiaceae bacterium]